MKRLQHARFANSIVFNIFGVRNQYSSSELVMSISYEKAGFIYTIFGILDVTQ
jgi:inositol 1,4,5-triphosphate receptor type 3